MQKLPDGGPAFPHPTEGFYDNPEQGVGFNYFIGMSLRDYFAAKIVSGLCGNLEFIADAEISNEQLALRSYALADEMLKARYVRVVADHHSVEQS